MTLISRSISLCRVHLCIPWVCKSLGRAEDYVASYPILFETNLKCIKFSDSAKYFHTCQNKYAKVFVEAENVRAHAWMEKNSAYSPTICKPLDLNKEIIRENLENVFLQDWKCRSATEIFAAFRDVSFISKKNSLQLSDPRLQNLIAALFRHCVDFDDSQILTTLQCLSLWIQSDSPKEEPYYELWTALDKECVKRLRNWDTNMALLVADHWQILHLFRWSEYIKIFLKKICRKLDRLPSEQFVQVMFYINLRRSLPVSSSKYEFTQAFENICERLSLEELSIATMGFFKTQTKLTNSRVGEVLLSRLESSLRTREPPVPDSITLAALLKMARYSASPTSSVIMKKVLDAVMPHLRNISLLCCLHVALMGTNIQVFHETVINEVCQRFATEIENARLKDIERLTLVLTQFNHDPNTRPCIYNTMVTEVRRRIAEAEKEGKMWYEMQRHGECLLRFLSFLSMRDIFPMDLIERAMDPNFIAHVYGQSWSKIGREVLNLDVNMEIRCQHQSKNRLCPKVRDKLVKKFCCTVINLGEDKKRTAANRLHFDILKTIMKFAGAEEKVATWRLLPHFERADIVFCTDGGEDFQDLNIRKKGTSVLKIPSNPGCWHAVVPCGINYTVKFTNKLTGPMVCKLKQLETLGYKTTLVPWFEWDALKIDEKPDYLRSKIFS